MEINKIRQGINVLRNLNLHEAADLLEESYDNKKRVAKLENVLDSFPVDMEELINNYELDTE